MKKQLLSSLAIAVLLILPMIVYAYPDNFDTYTPGVQNPGPWHYVPDSPSCWPQIGNTNAVLGLNGTAQTSPNVYEISFDTSCASAAHVTGLWMYVNASAPEINFSAYWKGLSGTAGATGTIITFVGGYTNSYSISALPLTWTQVYTSAVVVPGQVVKVGVNISVTGGGTAFSLAIDTTNVSGGNPVSSASNFFLIDKATLQWFNIASYSNSSMMIEYQFMTNCATYSMLQVAPNVCGLSDITIPDMEVALIAANLTTFYVGGSVPYTRTLIPLSSTKVSMYLDAPSPGTLVAYNVMVNDYTHRFVGGSTKFFISLGTTIITSGVIGADQSFALVMRPGTYQVKLLAADGSQFISSLVLGTAQTQVTMIIQSVTNQLPIGTLQEYSYSAGWDCDLSGIVASFTDSLNSTTKIWFSLIVQLPQTGPATLATGTAIGTFGTATYDFVNASMTYPIFSNESAFFFIKYNVTTPLGTTPFGPYPVPFGNPNCPNIFPSPLPAGNPNTFHVPDSVLGLGVVFPGGNAYETLLGTIVIVLTCAIFGARLAHIGLLVVSVELGLLTLMGWFSFSVVLIQALIFLGVLGFLSNRSRRPIT